MPSSVRVRFQSTLVMCLFANQLVACGGITSGEKNLSRGTPSGGASDGALPKTGAVGGSFGAGGEPVSGASSTLLPVVTLGERDNVVCSAFLKQWRVRQAEAELLDTPNALTSCYDCMNRSARECPAKGSECEPPVTCVARHCLCTPGNAFDGPTCLAPEYPVSLCDCAAPCFAGAAPRCMPDWLAQISCASEACMQPCSAK